MPIATGERVWAKGLALSLGLGTRTEAQGWTWDELLQTIARPASFSGDYEWKKLFMILP